jgi:tRNA-specific 2-thiouridylase
MPAQVCVHDGALDVVLASAATGIAPGQAVVLYDGDRVVGSATIGRTQG